MTRQLLVFAGVVGVVLFSGCSAQTVQGSPLTSASATTAGGSSTELAPKVRHSLPASVFDKHPCASALTDAQLKELISEVPPARHTDNAAGPGCGWTRTSTGAVITVGYLTGLKGGLSDVYAKKQTDAYQQPLEIDGYPAAAWNETEATPTTDCAVAVGIRDNLVFGAGFVVGSDRLGKQDPCDAAKVIAEKVLTNLKAAAG